MLIVRPLSIQSYTIRRDPPAKLIAILSAIRILDGMPRIAAARRSC
jgi:hypothetical protein